MAQFLNWMLTTCTVLKPIDQIVKWCCTFIELGSTRGQQRSSRTCVRSRSSCQLYTCVGCGLEAEHQLWEWSFLAENLIHGSMMLHRPFVLLKEKLLLSVALKESSQQVSERVKSTSAGRRKKSMSWLLWGYVKGTAVGRRWSWTRRYWSESAPRSRNCSFANHVVALFVSVCVIDELLLTLSDQRSLRCCNTSFFLMKNVKGDFILIDGYFLITWI